MAVARGPTNLLALAADAAAGAGARRGGGGLGLGGWRLGRLLLLGGGAGGGLFSRSLLGGSGDLLSCRQDGRRE